MVELFSEHLDTLQPEEPFEIFVFLRELQSPEGRRRTWDTLLNDPVMADGDMVFPISALLVREARLLFSPSTDATLTRAGLYGTLRLYIHTSS